MHTFLLGAVRVAGNLSALAGREIKFNAWAMDHGKPPRQTLNPASILISVKKINLFPPKFTLNYYEATLTLPTVLGVEVLCLTARDQDDSRNNNNTFFDTYPFQYNEKTKVAYSFSRDTERDHFQIEKTSGCIRVKSSINLKRKYTLTVVASDGSLASSTSVVVNVFDRHEKSLAFSQEKYYANVLENSTKELNLLVVHLDSVPVNHPAVFKILNPNKYLTVGRTSGVIRTTGIPFDRELHEEFSIVVQVSAIFSFCKKLAVSSFLFVILDSLISICYTIKYLMLF